MQILKIFQEPLLNSSIHLQRFNRSVNRQLRFIRASLLWKFTANSSPVPCKMKIRWQKIPSRKGKEERNEGERKRDTTVGVISGIYRRREKSDSKIRPKFRRAPAGALVPWVAMGRDPR